jgi:hypothetical protein
MVASLKYMTTYYQLEPVNVSLARKRIIAAVIELRSSG